MIKCESIIKNKTASVVKLLIMEDGIIVGTEGYSAAKKKGGKIIHDSVIESDKLQEVLKLIYKPLTANPEKWTQTHLLKCIVNNQFHHLKCTGSYTDDYYGDYLNNYGKDQEVNIEKLLDDIITLKPNIYKDLDLVKISFGFARYSLKVGFISGTPKK